MKRFVEFIGYSIQDTFVFCRSPFVSLNSPSQLWQIERQVGFRSPKLDQ